MVVTGLDAGVQVTASLIYRYFETLQHASGSAERAFWTVRWIPNASQHDGRRLPLKAASRGVPKMERGAWI